MKKRQFCLIIVLIFIYILKTPAGIVVRPTYLFIDSPEKSSSVTVKNTSENLLEVSIEFKYGYFSSDGNGNLSMETADTIDNYNKSLLKYVKVFPQNFTLAPDEIRTVRIYLDFPIGAEKGEYWARMYFIPKVLQKLQIQKKISKLDVVTIVDVPINYRFGNINTGIILENISEIKEGDGKIKFNTLLRSTGTASYWGNLSVKLLDKSGKIKGSITKNISVYKVLFIPFEINLEDKSATIDKIHIVAESKRTDIDPKKLIQSKKEEWTIPFKSND